MVAEIKIVISYSSHCKICADLTVQTISSQYAIQQNKISASSSFQFDE